MTHPESVAAVTDERAVRLASEAGRANLRIQTLERQAAEALDEVERLRGQVERLQVEKHDLIEQLIQQGSNPS